MNIDAAALSNCMVNASQEEDIQGNTLYIRDAKGSLFLLRGGAEEKIFGAGRGRAGRKCSGRGEVTVKPRGIFGVGRGILENFWGQGALGQPFPPGSGRGVHPCRTVTKSMMSYGMTRSACRNLSPLFSTA